MKSSKMIDASRCPKKQQTYTHIHSPSLSAGWPTFAHFHFQGVQAPAWSLQRLVTPCVSKHIPYEASRIINKGDKVIKSSKRLSGHGSTYFTVVHMQLVGSSNSPILGKSKPRHFSKNTPLTIMLNYHLLCMQSDRATINNLSCHKLMSSSAEATACARVASCLSKVSRANSTNITVIINYTMVAIKSNLIPSNAWN